MRSVRLRGSVAGLAILAWSAVGAAQSIPGVEVRWEVPAACPNSQDLQARVRKLLGADGWSGTPAPVELTVHGAVMYAHGRYRLRLDVQQEGQPAGTTRVFDSESCESLAGAAAVTLAVLIRGEPRPRETVSSAPTDSLTGPRSSPPLASTPPSSAGSPASEPTPADAHAARSTDATPSTPPTKPGEKGDQELVVRAPHPAGTGWSILVAGPLLTIDHSVLRSSGIGVGVGGGVRGSGLELLLTGIVWVPQKDSTGYANRYTARYFRAGGELSSCYGWSRGAFELAPCLTLGLEYVSAEGTGPDVVGTPDRIAWPTVGVAASAQWSPSPWMALFVRPRLTFNLLRPIFALEGIGALHQVPLAAAGLTVGIKWIL